MKNICLSIVVLLILSAGGNVFAEENGSGTTIFLGLNLGGNFATGLDEGTAINPGAFLYGGTIRFFLNDLGFGGTYNRATHEDDDGKPGNFESDISVATFDILYNFSKSDDFIWYVVGSLGQGSESISGEVSGIDFDTDFDTSIWGVGLGGFSSTHNSFSLGGEVRYINATDSENADGLLQFYFSIGYVF